MSDLDISVEMLKDNFIYEPDTGLLRWKVRQGRRISAGSIAGCKDSKGYMKVGFADKTMLRHRVAWAMYYGKHAEGMIDHRNGIRDDNRIENLRLADAKQNQQNRKAVRSKSGYKGVVCLPKGRFQAQIGGRAHTKYLGSFDTAEKAAKCYDDKAAEIYGEFASLNFPRGKDLEVVS